MSKMRGPHFAEFRELFFCMRNVFSPRHAAPAASMQSLPEPMDFEFSKKTILKDFIEVFIFGHFLSNKNVHFEKSEPTFVFSFYQQLQLRKHLKNQSRGGHLEWNTGGTPKADRHKKRPAKNNCRRNKIEIFIC